MDSGSSEMIFCAVARSDGMAFKVASSADARGSLENSTCASRIMTFSARKTKRQPAKLSLKAEFKITTRNIADIATEDVHLESLNNRPGMMSIDGPMKQVKDQYLSDKLSDCSKIHSTKAASCAK